MRLLGVFHRFLLLRSVFVLVCLLAELTPLYSL